MKTSSKAIEQSNADNSSTKVVGKKTRLSKRTKLRVLLSALLFMCFGIWCFYVACKTIEREKPTPINYTDANEVLYKVYLKENDVYKEPYLDMNRAYVANLIDHIDIDFNYMFNIERITNINFNYKIIANLIIENNNGVKYVDENYTLKDTTNMNLSDGGNQSITESVTIDYNYYNGLANKFKNTTGVDMVSYLNVYFILDKKTDENLNYKIEDTTKANIRIPLSERAIEINLTADKGITNKQVIPEGKVVFNPTYLIIEIILFIITSLFMILFMHNLFRIIKFKTPYEKYINKLLKNYDRVIVETDAPIDLSNCKMIDVKSFNELLDVRDNLKLPIIYSVLEENKKGIFYIKNDKDVYRLIIDEKELEK